MGKISYRKSGAKHQPKPQQPDRSSHKPEVMPGGIPGGGIKQWRQKDHEDDIGVQLDMGDPGDKADPQPGDHKKDKIGDTQLGAENRQHRYDKKQRHDK